MFEYFFTVMQDADSTKGSMFMGLCYKLDFKIDSVENMIRFCEVLKNDGYKNPVILFFKQLNE